MATYSQVKSGLDNVAEIIRNERQAALNCVARLSASAANLNALATTYADVVSTINGYGTSNAAEAAAKAELAKLTAEFQALTTKLGTANTGLAAIDFST